MFALQAFDEKQTQATMDSFLSYRQKFAKIKSKRLQRAVQALRKRDSNMEESDQAQDTATVTSQQVAKSTRSQAASQLHDQKAKNSEGSQKRKRTSRKSKA